jgi:ubiquinol-cytochrome c reductase cytochrome b subunit
MSATERALGGLGGWIDDRFRVAGTARRTFRKIFPDHWSFMLGEIALYSFIILLLTGTFLSLFFKPSMTDVVYHGSYTHLNGIHMSEAYASTLNISFDVRGGLLMRQIHHWAADLFMAAIMAHMLRIFFTGAYRKPREVNWLIGITLFILGMLEGLFGYSLPDDLLSGTGLRILEGVILAVPVVGTYLEFFLFGGQFPGQDIIPRLYVIHILLIPGLILALVTAHLFFMVHQKHTQMPGKGRTDQNVVGAPAFPYFAAKTGAFFLFVFGFLALLSTFAQINPIWLYGPYNPAQISAGSQPDFYMGILEGSLRIMPAWQVSALGHTVDFGVLIPMLLPLALIFTGAMVWPFVEQWVTGDRREHHVNDRPRNAPTRTAVGMAAVAFYGVLLLLGANDLVADFLQIPLYTVTWLGRVFVFLGPILAYIITKRVCVGLQLHDREMLRHGLETGVIRQLPSGAFVDAERPLTDEEQAVLTAKRELTRLPAPGATDENGVPSPVTRGAMGKLRVRLNHVFTEDEEILAEVAAAETDGHGEGNGHPDGHGERGELPPGSGDQAPAGSEPRRET